MALNSHLVQVYSFCLDVYETTCLITLSFNYLHLAETTILTFFLKLSLFDRDFLAISSIKIVDMKLMSNVSY